MENNIWIESCCLRQAFPDTLAPIAFGLYAADAISFLYYITIGIESSHGCHERGINKPFYIIGQKIPAVLLPSFHSFLYSFSSSYCDLTDGPVHNHGPLVNHCAAFTSPASCSCTYLIWNSVASLQSGPFLDTFAVSQNSSFNSSTVQLLSHVKLRGTNLNVSLLSKRSGKKKQERSFLRSCLS